MRFEIAFHGPFRVSTGLAGRGADVTVDMANPVPASSLKGVMRAAARNVLPRQEVLCQEVFGTARSPSPWAWSSASFVQSTRQRRARAAIDPVTGTAVDGALLFAEEVWSDRATFSIDPIRYLREETRRRHELVLLASAHAVHALGSDRRRGLGWVGLTGIEPVLDESALSEVIRLAAAAP